MAKTSSKPAAVKATATKAPAKAKSASADIEKLSEGVLTKLRTLNIEPQLQSDIEWCLGSYRADMNPVGLYDMVRRAIGVFQSELQKKTKGVTAKWVADLEKVVDSK